MRASMLGVSIVVHLCVMAGVIVAPLFATGELPTPRRAAAYVLVTGRIPETPPVARPRTPETPPTNAAPLAAPDTVAPAPPGPDSALPGPTDFDAPDPSANAVAPYALVVGDPLPPPPPPPAALSAPVRVGGDIRPPQKIHDVAPRYPVIAQASKVEGLVILEAVIGEDGAVQHVRVLRGQPLLDEAAAQAVRQWRFTPTLLNGQPVPVVMTVTVSFTLR